MRRALLASMGSSRSFVRVVYRRNSWQDAFREIAVSLHLHQCHCLHQVHQVQHHISLLLRWQARIKSDAVLQAWLVHLKQCCVKQGLPYVKSRQCLARGGVTDVRLHLSKEAAASFSSRSIPIIVVSLLLSMTAVRACMARHTCTHSAKVCFAGRVVHMMYCCYGQHGT